MELEEYTALDEAVAVKVMGWHKGEYQRGNNMSGYWMQADGKKSGYDCEDSSDQWSGIDFDFWEPSDRMDHAIVVAQQMIAKDWIFYLTYNTIDKAWLASFGLVRAQGKTAAEAICRAALAAVDDDDSEGK